VRFEIHKRCARSKLSASWSIVFAIYLAVVSDSVSWDDTKKCFRVELHLPRSSYEEMCDYESPASAFCTEGILLIILRELCEIYKQSPTGAVDTFWQFLCKL
jgi:hypothetical protein